MLCSRPSRSLMSLLNILHCSFPPVLSSPTDSRSRPFGVYNIHAKNLHKKNSASPLAGVGCLAEWLTQLQTQVMSPSSLTSSATWIWSTRRSVYLTATTNATVISTTVAEGLPRSGASSSSKHTAASRVPSMFRPSSLWKQMARHVSGRPGLHESGAVSDRESLKLRREIEKRKNADFALSDFNYTKPDQAPRDKISLYGKLELRNRLFQENHARDCQAI